MSDERQWCIICGQPRGNCKHMVGFTTSISKAYLIWLAEQKRLRELGKATEFKSL